MGMVALERTLPVAAPARATWNYVTDWTRHGEWIPLTRVELVDDPARQVGARFRGWTGVGPVGFVDPMTITGWEERADGSGRCTVVHTGRVVKGEAEIEITARGAGACTLRWTERVILGRFQRVGWALTSGMVRMMLDRSLSRLVMRVESEAGR